MHWWCNCVLSSSAVNRVFKSKSSQTKYYKIGICCFSAKQAAFNKVCTGQKFICYLTEPSYTELVLSS